MLNQRKGKDDNRIIHARIKEIRRLQKIEAYIENLHNKLALAETQRDELHNALSWTQEFKRIRSVGSTGIQYDFSRI